MQIRFYLLSLKGNVTKSTLKILDILILRISLILKDIKKKTKKNHTSLVCGVLNDSNHEKWLVNGRMQGRGVLTVEGGRIGKFHREQFRVPNPIKIKF